jgi:hypothetical protein
MLSNQARDTPNLKVCISCGPAGLIQNDLNFLEAQDLLVIHIYAEANQGMMEQAFKQAATSRMIAEADVPCSANPRGLNLLDLNIYILRQTAPHTMHRERPE